MRSRKWGVFWDNCPSHKAVTVKNWLEKNDVPVIHNLPYKPALNGVENVWA